MTLYDTITEDRKTAMKQKEQFKRDVLTVFLGDLQSDEKRGEDINDAYVIQKLKKASQNAVDNYELTEQQKFKDEKDILEQYIPKQLDSEELGSIIRDVINNTEDPNIGLIMKHLKTNYDGQYDGREASTIAKSMIAELNNG